MASDRADERCCCWRIIVFRQTPPEGWPSCNRPLPGRGKAQGFRCYGLTKLNWIVVLLGSWLFRGTEDGWSAPTVILSHASEYRLLQRDRPVIETRLGRTCTARRTRISAVERIMNF